MDAVSSDVGVADGAGSLLDLIGSLYDGVAAPERWRTSSRRGRGISVLLAPISFVTIPRGRSGR